MTEFFIDNKFMWFVGILIIIDIITGIAKATTNHRLKSAIFRNGGYKKFLILIVICLTWSMDKIYFQNDVLYTLSCTYYIINEAISITENLGKCGVPIPKKLKNILEELKDKEK